MSASASTATAAGFYLKDVHQVILQRVAVVGVTDDVIVQRHHLKLERRPETATGHGIRIGKLNESFLLEERPEAAASLSKSSSSD